MALISVEFYAGWASFESLIRIGPIFLGEKVAKRLSPEIRLGVDSLSILFNHRSFQKPAVFPGLLTVSLEEGFPERMGKAALEYWLRAARTCGDFFLARKKHDPCYPPSGRSDPVFSSSFNMFIYVH